jgi:hypothetical protein
MNLLPTIEIDNLFTKESLNSITDQLHKINDFRVNKQVWEGPNLGKVLANKYYCSPEKNPEVIDFFLSHLPKEIADRAIAEEFYQLQSFIPYEIHCDSGHLHLKDDEEPYYLFIVPLETVDVRTIVFDQISNDLHFTEYKEVNKPLPDAEQMTEEEYQQYFSHCWPQERPYLSINHVFKWQAGKLLACDMHYFHASDNYIKNGLTEKNCLVLMTKTKKK